MIVSMFLNGCQSGGIIPLPLDLSNEYSATIFGIFNMVGMTAGFISPLVIGFILDYNPTYLKHQWWIVLYFIIAIRIICGLLFVLFISTDRINWNDVDEKKLKSMHNMFNFSQTNLKNEKTNFKI